MAATMFLALPCLAESQTAILQIRVAEGEGVVHPAGSRNTLPLIVQVTDETGKPVEHATVTFHLPDDGPGGTFQNGLHTDISTTDSTGHARIRTLQWNRVPGPFQIRIVAAIEQVHAGIISFQYIDGPAIAQPTNPRHTLLQWKFIAGLAASGAAAGILLGHSRGGAQPAPSVPSVTIGSPSLALGKP
jgi:hypothetical protein